MSSTPYLKNRGCPKLDAHDATITIVSYIDLQGRHQRKPVLKDKHGNDIMKSKRHLTTGTTGSNTFVWLITTIDDEKFVCKTANNYKIVNDKYEKLNNARYARVLAGQKYEKQMYDLMYALVNDHISPFVLQKVNIKSYSNSICTETNESAISLSKYIRSHKPQIKEFKKILFAILYTIDCFSRIGVRHSDLHPGNILMIPVEKYKSPIIFDYVTTDGKTYRFDLSGMTWIPAIYDFDRAFKIERHAVKAKFSKDISPGPVTSRWQYYNAHLDTPQLNVLKILSHLHNEVTKSKLKDHIDMLSPHILTPQQRNRMQQLHNFNERKWTKYHIPVKRHGQEINISHVVPKIEDLLLQLLPQSDRPGPAHFSMKRIYLASICCSS